jgi:cellulose synthase/poly-beta-1,6-N-acetylglucosamine synthase-like glycosyltransferase
VPAPPEPPLAFNTVALTGQPQTGRPIPLRVGDAAHAYPPAPPARSAATARPKIPLREGERTRPRPAHTPTDGLLARLLSEHWASWGAARDGARVVITRAQGSTLALLALVCAGLLVTHPHALLITALGFVTALYLTTGLHKIWLLVRGERALNSDAVGSLPATGDDLPLYTVLVPLYREERMLPLLIERLKSIDYPPARLEVLLLIGSDDDETQRVARAYTVPSHIRVVDLPPGHPRTKPRSLNIGLHEARGEYIVIYDAEDQPEHLQLRRAVAAFRQLPPDVACLQSRLTFYNQRQSLLTRLFSAEFALWYNQLLPGLTHAAGDRTSGIFVPLSGTSLHLPTTIVRQLGGWDPFNVTEDIDLSVRLGRKGLRVAALDSTTWEEAVPRLVPWLRQRSRWVKGWLQTYLVHMRHPLVLWRQLGLRGFADFQMLVGGSSFLLLVNPLMWMLTALYVGTRGTHIGNYIQTLLPPALFYPALLTMLAGNFIFFYCTVYACVRHNFHALTRSTLLTPVYWVLMSAGAWVGLVNLVLRPFYWAKTEHGSSLSATDSPAARAVGALMRSDAHAFTAAGRGRRR